MNRFGWSTWIGFVGWLALWLTPLPGQTTDSVIGMLFLLAPLVIVPLALRTVSGSIAISGWMTTTQPFAAWLAVVSLYMPTGGVTAIIGASAWMGLTLVLGGQGLRALCGGAWRRADRFAVTMGLAMIPAGGIGFLLSRCGATPFGIEEPLILLTGVHFHYAAFVSPIMAALAMRGRDGRLEWWTAMSVVAGSPLLAVGFVMSMPVVRMLGAVLLVAGMMNVALKMVLVVVSLRSNKARALVMVSATSLAMGLAFALVYAVADGLGRVWIPIGVMAWTHGILNAVGFALCGLAGWAMEHEIEPVAIKRMTGALTRRWMV